MLAIESLEYKNTLRGCFHYTFAFVFLCQVSVAFAVA